MAEGTCITTVDTEADEMKKNVPHHLVVEKRQLTHFF